MFKGIIEDAGLPDENPEKIPTGVFVLDQILSGGIDHALADKSVADPSPFFSGATISGKTLYGMKAAAEGLVREINNGYLSKLEKILEGAEEGSRFLEVGCIKITIMRRGGGDSYRSTLLVSGHNFSFGRVGPFHTVLYSTLISLRCLGMPLCENKGGLPKYFLLDSFRISHPSVYESFKRMPPGGVLSLLTSGKYEEGLTLAEEYIERVGGEGL